MKLLAGRRASRQPGSKPPTVGGLPLVGPVARLSRDPLGFMKGMVTAGPMVRVQLGARDMYFLNHPDLIQEALVARADEFIKEGMGTERLGPLAGNGLPHIDGEPWSRARKMMRPGFTQRTLKAQAEVMVDSVEAELQSWERVADTGQPIDLGSALAKVTMAVLTSTIFGFSLSDDERETLDRDFAAFNSWINWRLWTPGFPEWSPLPGKAKGEAALQRIDALLYRLMDERKREPDKHDDLLAMLVNARSEDDGSMFTDSDMRDHAMNLLFAGHETTAVTTTWTLALLERHPAWEERVLAEVDAVLGDRRPSFDDWQKLKVVLACFEEAMRMYPPAFINGRSAAADCELGGYPVPKGTMVMFNVVGAHHHPDFWPAPESFDPTRFLDGNDKGRHLGSYFPFGIGQRACIGRHMGTVEAVLTLAMIFQRYRLRLKEGTTLDPKIRMSIQFKDGPQMCVSRRSGLTLAPRADADGPAEPPSPAAQTNGDAA
jgi:cytochrome P450